MNNYKLAMIEYYLVSRDGYYIGIEKNHELLKNDYFNKFYLNKKLNYDKIFLESLLDLNFGFHHLNYDEMIAHSKLGFPLSWKKYNNFWLIYFKKIIYDSPELFYYKYHIDYYFENNNIKKIISSNNTFDVFLTRIKNEKLNNIFSYIETIDKHYRNILLAKNCTFSNDVLKNICSNDIVMYHVINNNSLNSIVLDYSINYISYNTFELLIRKYGNEISEHLYSEKDLFNMIYFFLNKKALQRYKTISYLYHDRDLFVEKCIFISFKYNYIGLLQAIRFHENNFVNLIHDFILKKNYSFFLSYDIVDLLDIFNCLLNKQIIKFVLENCNDERLVIKFDKWLERYEYNKYFEIFVLKNMKKCYEYFLDKKYILNIKNDQVILTLIFFERWDILNDKIKLFFKKNKKLRNYKFLTFVDKQNEIKILNNVKIPIVSTEELLKFCLYNKKIFFVLHIVNNDHFSVLRLNYLKIILENFEFIQNSGDIENILTYKKIIFNLFIFLINKHFDNEFPFFALIVKNKLYDDDTIKIYANFFKLNIKKPCNNGKNAYDYAVVNGDYKLLNIIDHYFLI